MKALLLTATITTVLAVLLTWRSPLITRGFYQVGFALGFASFIAALLWSPSNWTFYSNRPTVFAVIVVSALAAMIPYVLLLEAGISGFRGFSSWMRYLSLLIAILGGAGAVGSVILPWLQRR